MHLGGGGFIISRLGKGAGHCIQLSYTVPRYIHAMRMPQTAIPGLFFPLPITGKSFTDAQHPQRSENT